MKALLLLASLANPCPQGWVQHDKLLNAYRSVYEETRRYMALSSLHQQTVVLEFLFSHKNNSFSIIITKTDGCSAPLAYGRDWEEVFPTKGKKS